MAPAVRNPAARGLAARPFGLAIFTSSIRLDRLFDGARELGIEKEVQESLRTHVAIASVGPVMTATLEAAGLPPDIIPNYPKMGSLVKAAADETEGQVGRKRSGVRG